MKKIILLPILLFLIPLATAQLGCFLDQNSPYFCQEVELSLAQRECVDDCVLTKNFRVGKLCDTFPECQKIACKATCTYEPRGNCGSGEIPVGKENEFCSPGCCKFNYQNQNFCQQLENYGQCEIQAKNRGINNFNFDTTSKECSCQPGELIASSQKNTKTSQTEISFPYVWLLIVFLFFIVLYIIWKKKIIKKLFQPAPPIPKSEEPTNKFLQIFSPFFSSSRRRARIKKLQREHQLKMKKNQQEQFLAASGLAPPPPANDHISKLRRISRVQEIRNKYKKTTFKNLDQVIDKVKEAEEKEKQKEEQEKAMLELRGMSEK